MKSLAPRFKIHLICCSFNHDMIRHTSINNSIIEIIKYIEFNWREFPSLIRERYFLKI